ncbi:MULTISPECIES: cytochrome P450 [Micromonospora]|uniref:Cytochrome P450 n=1 Tax=Micromonospora solifontis TaxID=2487138 RepID=A0ABX9WBX4_9ACTN|nr:MULTISPECIES: cytochrome P450 [Micromonospora]NES17180.1 cytochrome P450 [Micromonospora sp. PPF5-17B]NES39280.1 cytochrome P450 [Micromonospora solifontis]NES58994.1 cytochrome P450 [Micromonospora sp. PPF5-6]RNL89630.1 cytochrome P450 [Micromonospora solifontis]
MLFRGWGESVDGSWPDVATVVDHVGVPHLVVTRHALVRRLLTDPATFRPDNALDAVTPIPVAALRVLAGHRFRLPPTLANNSSASHPEIRGIVADALHPDRVAAQQPWLTALVRRRVAGLAAALDAGRPVDLYAELAADLPLLVLARLVELPDAPVGAVKDFARAALELFWAPLDEARQLALAAEVGRFHTVLRAFATTGGGLAARLRAAGHSPDVVVGALFFLLVAGQETTSQFLTLLLHRLVGEPEVRAGLRRGEIAVADVVEEGLRLEPPIVTWRRVAAVDTTLGDAAVPAGTSIVAWLARAGRDAAVVAAPDEFRPGQRGSRRHLAFGAGAHRCVGAQLARMEAAVVVAEAAALLDGVTVVRAPWCPDNLTFRMPDAFVIGRD